MAAATPGPATTAAAWTPATTAAAWTPASIRRPTRWTARPRTPRRTPTPTHPPPTAPDRGAGARACLARRFRRICGAHEVHRHRWRGLAGRRPDGVHAERSVRRTGRQRVRRRPDRAVD